MSRLCARQCCVPHLRFWHKQPDQDGDHRASTENRKRCPPCLGPKCGRRLDVEERREQRSDDEHRLEQAAGRSTPGADLDRAALKRTLDMLISEQGIAPHNVLVITCRSQKASAVYSRRTLGKHQLTAKLAARHERSVPMPIVTVRSAKGLEADVVILTELEGIERNAKRSNLLYVATSRAKHHLIVHRPRDTFLPRQPALATTLVTPNIAP